eukprot:CAMPEP_0180129928 /NCGR_PEP_ID=MMETSP0986-20121125/7583_1 /TAXON_ID=697907 /ORGANISM="non described non described, Strain CCMP2293" /LENGTH=900 /DNA_ID=CAMNT_0022069641 /DNA_START=479 /DNA_END=3181 /DNA_ORIENTATION=+
MHLLMTWAKDVLHRHNDFLFWYDNLACKEYAGLVQHMSHPRIHFMTHCKIFLSKILPINVSKVLYLDTDIAVVGDLGSCFHHQFSADQFLGMSVDSGNICQRFPSACSWPIAFSHIVPPNLRCGEVPKLPKASKLTFSSGHEYCPLSGEQEPLQFNGGVILMDLAKMRMQSFADSYVNVTTHTWRALGCKEASWGEQDFINNFFRIFPNSISVLPCGCNYQSSSIRRQIVCPHQPISIVHPWSAGMKKALQKTGSNGVYLGLFRYLFLSFSCIDCPHERILPHNLEVAGSNMSERSILPSKYEDISRRMVFTPRCPHQKEVRLLLEGEQRGGQHSLGQTVFVITRTSHRKRFFLDCQRSIDMQSYPYIVHVVIADSQVHYVEKRQDLKLNSQGFLEKPNLVLNAPAAVLQSISEFTGQEPCTMCGASPPMCDTIQDGESALVRASFRECYCKTPFPMNRLFQVAHKNLQNKTGFVIYLDDDNLLADQSAIATLMSFVNSQDVVYAVSANLGRVTPLLKNFGSSQFVRGDIDTANLALHTRNLKWTDWGSTRCGDFRTVFSLSRNLPVTWPLSRDKFIQSSHPLRSVSGGHGKMPDYPQLTVVSSAYHVGPRLRPQLEYLESLCTMKQFSLISKVLFVWNGAPGQAPSVRNVELLISGKNSLNNRWQMILPYIFTDAILVLDDDVRIRPPGIICLHSWWMQHPYSLIGPFARRVEIDRDTGQFRYFMSEMLHKRPRERGRYNIILPRALIIHRHWVSLYSGVGGDLLDYVDNQEAHCDDILLNALVLNASRSPPLRVALPAGSLVDCDDWGRKTRTQGYHGLTDQPGKSRQQGRNICADFIFSQVFGDRVDDLFLTELTGRCQLHGDGRPQSNELHPWSDDVSHWNQSFVPVQGIDTTECL